MVDLTRYAQPIASETRRPDLRQYATSTAEPLVTKDGAFAVVDGDTVDVLDADGRAVERVRLFGVDAPEKSLATGTFAKTRLHELLNTGRANLSRRGKDSHGRTLGTLTDADGKDVGAQLVETAGTRSSGYEHAYDKEATRANNEYLAGRVDPRQLAALEATEPFTRNQFARPGRRPGDFTAGVVSGVHQLQGSLHGLASLAGDALDVGALRDFGNKGYVRNQLEAERDAPSVTSIKDIDDADDFFDWAAGALGQAVPSLGVSVATGGVGAAIAKKTVAIGIERALAQKAAEELAKGGIAKEAAEQAVRRVLGSPATHKRLLSAAKRGATAGVATSSAATQAGETQGELQVAGISAPGTAVVSGLLGGALDALPAAKLIDDLFPGVDRALAKSFVSGMAKSLGVQTLLEGSTEATQEVISIAARAMHDPNFDWKDPQQLQRIVDAGAAGALVGFVGGLAGGSAQGIRAKQGTTDGKDEAGRTAAGSEQGDPRGATRDAAQREPDLEGSRRADGGDQQGSDVSARPAAPGRAERSTGVDPAVASHDFNPPPVEGAAEEAEPDRAAQSLTAKFQQPSVPPPDRVVHGQRGSRSIFREGAVVSGRVQPYTAATGAIEAEVARLEQEYPNSNFTIAEQDDGFVIHRDDGPDVDSVFDARSASNIARPDFIAARAHDALISVHGGKDRFGAEQKGNDDPTIRGYFQYENGKGKTVTRRLSMPEVTKLGMDLDTDGRQLPLGQRVARGVSEGVQAVTESGKFRFQWDKLSDETVVYQDAQRKVTWGQVRKGVEKQSRRQTSSTIRFAKSPEGEISRAVEAAAPSDRKEILELAAKEGFPVDEERIADTQSEYDPALIGQETEDQQAARSARDRAPGRADTQKARAQDIRAARRGLVSVSMDSEQAGAIAELAEELTKVAGLENQFWIVDKGAAARGVAPTEKLSATLKQAAKDDPAGRVMFDGEHVVIYLSDRLNDRSPANVAAVLGHEIGHVVEQVYYGRLSSDMKSRMQASFERSREKSFDEWMANQFVAWASRTRAPRNAMESFFKRVGAALKQMFDLLAGRFRLNETFDEFMNGVAEYAKRGKQELVSPIAMHFESLGVVGTRYWSGLPAADTKNFTPPRLMAKIAARKAKQKLKNYQTAVGVVSGAKDVAMELHDVLTASLDGRLRRTGVKALVRLANKFRQPAGTKLEEETFFRSVRAGLARFGRRSHELVDGLSDKELQELGEDARAATGQFRNAAAGKKLRNLLDEIYEYLHLAGLPIDKLKNYYPIIYSHEKLLADPQGFKQIVMQELRIPQTEADDLYDSLLDETSPAFFQHNLGATTNNPSVGNIKRRDLWHKLSNKASLNHFMESDAKAVLERYIKSSVRMAEYNRLFGSTARKVANRWLPWNPNEKLDDLLTLAVHEGATAQQMRFVNQALDAYFGKVGMDMSPNVRKFLGGAMLYQNLRVLLFTLFASFVDIAGPAIRAGSIRTAFRGMKGAIAEAAKEQSALKEMARTYGVISDTFNDHVLTEGFDNHWVSPTVQKWNERFFKATGVKWWTDFTRSLSLAVGREFLLEHAGKAAAGDADSGRKLGELGLTAGDVQRWDKAGRPTYGARGVSFESAAAGHSTMAQADLAVAQKVAQALRRFGDEAVIRPDASTRPKWASDPKWMLVWHLKSFMYGFQLTFMNRIWHEMNRRKATTAQQLAPLIPAIMLLPIAALGLELRELLQYGDEESPYDKMDADEYIFELAKRSGIFGLSQLAIDFNEAENRDRIGLVALMGPTAAQFEELLSTAPDKSLPRAVPVLSQSPWLRDAIKEFYDGD